MTTSESALSPTGRSTILRKKDRARTDRADLHAVLDSALICHLGLVVDGAPRVLPTGYCRVGETLYLHGSTGARSLRDGLAGVPVCVTVSLLDGVVYSRAVFDFSVNYRCAVIHGRTRGVTDPEEKRQALWALTERLAPGSWEHARQPNKRELAQTAVVAVPLAEASVKVRDDAPQDEEDDVRNSTAWAGVLPLHHYWGQPESCPELPADVPVPTHVRNRRLNQA